MKNIILIYPPNSSVYAIKHQNDFLYYSEEFVVIPTGLLCLATYLKNNGDCSVNILNLSYEYAVYIEKFRAENKKKKGNKNQFDFEKFLQDILSEYIAEYKAEIILNKELHES